MDSTCPMELDPAVGDSDVEPTVDLNDWCCAPADEEGDAEEIVYGPEVAETEACGSWMPFMGMGPVPIQNQCAGSCNHCSGFVCEDCGGCCYCCTCSLVAEENGHESSSVDGDGDGTNSGHTSSDINNDDDRSMEGPPSEGDGESAELHSLASMSTATSLHCGQDSLDSDSSVDSEYDPNDWTIEMESCEDDDIDEDKDSDHTDTNTADTVLGDEERTHMEEMTEFLRAAYVTQTG